VWVRLSSSHLTALACMLAVGITMKALITRRNNMFTNAEIVQVDSFKEL